MSVFGYILKSFYKNDVCIEAGRKFKWWAALIYFLLATIISVIPITVQTCTVDGGSIITSNTYEVDNGLVAFTEKFLATNELEFNLINEANGENKNYDDVNVHNSLRITSSDESYSNQNYTKPLFSYNGYYLEEDENNNTIDKERTILEVWDFTYFPRERQTEKIADGSEKIIMPSYNDMITLLSSGSSIPQNIDDIVVLLQDKANNSSSSFTRQTSFLAFGKYTFNLYKYNAKGTLSQAMTGDYVNINLKQINNILSLSKNEDSHQRVIESWQIFFRDGYLSIKIQTAVIQISIVLAVNSAIILIMSLVIFLVTRGKNNPFKVYKYHECLKICCWIALSPAILTLIFGFVFPSVIGIFLFVLTYGIRALFMWTKNFRVYNNQ